MQLTIKPAAQGLTRAKLALPQRATVQVSAPSFEPI
jgi:hypothetical protein